MAKTYEPIATYTIPSAQASYTFNSIPSTYTDLCLKGSLRSSDAAAFVNYQVKFNNSGGTAYSVRMVYGTGSAAASAAERECA